MTTVAASRAALGCPLRLLKRSTFPRGEELPALVHATREAVLNHAGAARRVLQAAERYSRAGRARGRLVRTGVAVLRWQQVSSSVGYIGRYASEQWLLGGQR